MLYKVALTLHSEDETSSVTIQMKTTEEFFFVILFIMLYKVVWMNSSRVTIKIKATKRNI